MQQFSHDYTKVSEAMESLYSATRLIANECYQAALQRINEARTILSEYLAQDNMIPDNDVADGWVRHSEAQAELENLRSRVGDTHRSAPDGSRPSVEMDRKEQIIKEQIDEACVMLDILTESIKKKATIEPNEKASIRELYYKCWGYMALVDSSDKY